MKIFHSWSISILLIYLKFAATIETDSSRSRENLPQAETSKKLKRETEFSPITNQTELKPGQAKPLEKSIKEIVNLLKEGGENFVWFSQFYENGNFPLERTSELENLCQALWTKTLKENHVRTCTIKLYQKINTAYRLGVFNKQADFLYCSCTDNKKSSRGKKDGKTEKFYIYQLNDKEYIELDPGEKKQLYVKKMYSLK